MSSWVTSVAPLPAVDLLPSSQRILASSGASLLR